MQERFDAIVLAGYDPDRAHAFTATHEERYKVLIEAGGRPMLARVLDALQQTTVIDRCVVVGFAHDPLDEHAPDATGPNATGINTITDAHRPGQLHVATDGAPTQDAATREAAPVASIHYIPNQGSIYANLLAAFYFLGERQPNDRHVFLVSADVPLLTPAHVAWFVGACRPLDKDLYMAIVEKAVMEQTFPQSTRTYIPLREGQFCNGELMLVRISAALNRQAIYQDIISRRKSPLRQVQLLGPGLLFKFFLRRLGLADVLEFVRRRIRIEAAAIPLPFAETGMDVDKPAQLALVETYLTQHSSLQQSTLQQSTLQHSPLQSKDMPDVAAGSGQTQALEGE